MIVIKRKTLFFLVIPILLAGLIFTLNVHYGNQIETNLLSSLKQTAKENNYQLRLGEIEVNPLLRSFQFEEVVVTDLDSFEVELNNSNLKVSWQQMLYYIKNSQFDLINGFTAKVDHIDYADLIRNQDFILFNAVLDFKGELTKEMLINKSAALLNNNQQLSLTAEEAQYNYLYYKNFGFTDQSWRKISSFSDLTVNANYQATEQALKIEDIKLQNEILELTGAIQAGLQAHQAELQTNQAGSQAKQAEVIEVVNLHGNYDFMVDGSQLKFGPTEYTEDYSFQQITMQADFDLLSGEKEKAELVVNDYQLDLFLDQVVILPANNIREQLSQTTYGLINIDENTGLKIDSWLVALNYDRPQAEVNSEILTPAFGAELAMGISYDQDPIYISNSKLVISGLGEGTNRFIMMLELLTGRKLQRDAEGNIIIEAWGSLHNLNFK